MYIEWNNLEVWKKSHNLVLKVYELTNVFPKEEIYGITSQIRRAAYSVPVNIVEGKARKNTKEFIQFLNIANASLEEVRYFLLLAKDIGYMTHKEYISLENRCKEISKMLNSFINSLKRKLKNA